jgi:Methyltransferase domain
VCRFGRPTLWFSVSENIQRIRDAGVEDGVFPIYADARSLPFATEFFDAIVCIDSFCYYGTDDLYLNYLAGLVKPGGQIGIAGAGLVQEIEGPLPEHLCRWWTPELSSLHSASWWRQHWERTGIMDIDLADTMPDSWQRWLDWHRVIAPNNELEISALEADRGRFLGYVRLTVAAGGKQIWQITLCPCQLSTRKSRCSGWRNSNSFGIVTSGMNGGVRGKIRAGRTVGARSPNSRVVGQPSTTFADRGWRIVYGCAVIQAQSPPWADSIENNGLYSMQL